MKSAELFDSTEMEKYKPPLVEGAPPLPRIKMVEREQSILNPTHVEDLIDANHPARAIWEFIGELDLEGYYKGIRAVEGVAGREMRDPRVMICVWVYAYSRGIGSGREVGQLTQRDSAFQWITGMDPINYHSLTDFRIEYDKELKNLFTQVLGILSSEGLVTLERVMHDGTKVKAKASRSSFRTEKALEEHLELARKQVEAMGDARTTTEVGPRVKAARERALREKEKRLEKAKEELKKIREGKKKSEEKKARASETDPEARVMKQGDGGYAPSYNVQISTDSQEKVIVGVEATQSASDSRELLESMDRVEENCGEPVKEVVVDGGFTNRETIMEMDQRGIDMVGSIQDSDLASDQALARRGVEADFWPDKFVYDQKANTYRCPAGAVLKYEEKEKKVGQTMFHYRANPKDCRGCPFLMKCCPQNIGKGRKIVRRHEDPVVVSFRKKMETEKAKKTYRERSEVAEFPNAWIKAKIGLRQFNVVGKRKVGLEATWACLTYNIQIWIRLIWQHRKCEVAT